MVNVYYLTTKQDNYNPIYVGITKMSLKRRLSGHLNDAKKGNSKVHNWVKNRIISEDERRRLKEIRKLVTPKRKPILALTSDFKVLYFESITEAANTLKCIRTNMSKVLNYERKSVNGYYFCFVGSTCPIKIG